MEKNLEKIWKKPGAMDHTVDVLLCDLTVYLRLFCPRSEEHVSNP